MTKNHHLETVILCLAGECHTMKGVVDKLRGRESTIDKARREFGRRKAFMTIAEIILCTHSAEEALAQVERLAVPFDHKDVREGYYKLRDEALQGIKFAIENGDDDESW